MNLKDHAKKYNSKYKQSFLFSFEEDKLHLIPCSKVDPEFAQLYVTHYPGSLGIIGRQFHYKIYNGDVMIGIVGVSAPPLNYLLFNKYFDKPNLPPGIQAEKHWCNNNVYRLVKGAENRGTKVLKLFRERVFKDYYKKYKMFLKGLITFVEPPRTGIIYKADNWNYLGLTQGIRCTNRVIDGQPAKKTYTQGVKKHIFAMKFPERYKNRILNELKRKGVKK